MQANVNVFCIFSKASGVQTEGLESALDELHGSYGEHLPVEFKLHGPDLFDLLSNCNNFFFSSNKLTSMSTYNLSSYWFACSECLVSKLLRIF